MKNKALDLFIKTITTDIQKIENTSNKVQALVSYYQLLEFVENADHLGKAYLERLEKRNFLGLNKKKIQIIKSFFRNDTRDMYGVNRSKSGQMLTANDIYLGNIDGIWTKNASFWLSNKSKYEQEKMEVISKSVWSVINEQADDILKKRIQVFQTKKVTVIAA
jgi:hypothetical protein